MRLLCVWTAERSPRFPDVPTLKDLGYDMVVTSPYGLSGPKGMDAGVVKVLHDALKAQAAAVQQLLGGAAGDADSGHGPALPDMAIIYKAWFAQHDLHVG